MTATTAAARFSVLFAAIVPSLSEPAHASDECRPDHQLSALASVHGATLSGPFGVEQVEAQKTITIRENGVAGVPLPFGTQNRRWEDMKAAMKPGDQLYHLAVDNGAFHAAYYILVRSGCVIDSLMEYIT